MIALSKLLTLDIIKNLAKANLLKLTVNGISMCPLIQPGDIVSIATSESYETPDILLYPYKNEGLLLHRLLKVNNRLFCKGDNAFRLEDICAEDVIGKVVELQRNGEKIYLPAIDRRAIALSLQISEDFHKGRYDKNLAMQQKSYQLFAAYLRKLSHEENDKK